MTKRNNNGYILITCLLMLLILTVIGLAALGTSTIENLISGNMRLHETNLAKADGCSEISLKVVERAVRNDDTRGFADMVTDPNLSFELRTGIFDPDQGSPADADVTCDSNSGDGPTALVDIDEMMTGFLPGSAIEFASGYEGIGKGAGSGYATYYRINSSGSGLMNSTSNVGSVYIYVP